MLNFEKHDLRMVRVKTIAVCLVVCLVASIITGSLEIMPMYWLTSISSAVFFLLLMMGGLWGEN